VAKLKVDEDWKWQQRRRLAMGTVMFELWQSWEWEWGGAQKGATASAQEISSLGRSSVAIG
jgi:hypothetical protein